MVSVEHDADWQKSVSAKLLAENLLHAECRLITLDHPLDEPTQNYYTNCPRYVAVVEDFLDESLDFIVVDGHYRGACILAALEKLRSWRLPAGR
ncbi:MAG: hypothetical protein QM706_00890 [Nitrospira sp.]